MNDLVLRAADGDELAFARLLRELDPLLRHHAGAMFAPGLEWDDFMQEARIALYSAVMDWSPGKGAAFVGFANMVLSRRLWTVVLTARRAKHGPLNGSLDLLGPPPGIHDPEVQLADVLGTEADDPLRRVIDREALAELRVKAERLSPLERAVVAGQLAGMTYEQVAAGLVGDQKTVDNALQRARRKLAA